MYVTGVTLNILLMTSSILSLCAKSELSIRVSTCPMIACISVITCPDLGNSVDNCAVKHYLLRVVKDPVMEVVLFVRPVVTGMLACLIAYVTSSASHCQCNNIMCMANLTIDDCIIILASIILIQTILSTSILLKSYGYYNGPSLPKKHNSLH